MRRRSLRSQPRTIRRGNPLQGETERPRRGSIWLVEFSPSIGREIRNPHPALVVSADPLNKSPWGLIIVCPLTTARKENPFRLHIPVAPPEVKHPSVIRVDQVKSVSVERFIKPVGAAAPKTMAAVEAVLKKALALE